jgi:hypothetical protein
LLFCGTFFYFFDILILNSVSRFILIFAQLLYTIAAISIGFRVIFLFFTRFRFPVDDDDDYLNKLQLGVSRNIFSILRFHTDQPKWLT